MSITSKKLMKKADYLANEYNTAGNGTERDQIKAEWYREISRVAAHIQTHSNFFTKKNKKNF